MASLARSGVHDARRSDHCNVSTRQISDHARRLLEIEGSLQRPGYTPRYQLRADFLSQGHQPDITPANRMTIVDWIVLTADAQWLHCGTTACGIALLDLYLSRVPNISRKDIQNLAITCLRIASKLLERDPLSFEDCISTVHPRQDSYHHTEPSCASSGPHSDEYRTEEAYQEHYQFLENVFTDLEMKICMELEWNVSPSTVVDWVTLLCQQLGLLADVTAATDLSVSSSIYCSHVAHKKAECECDERDFTIDRSSFAALMSCTSEVYSDKGHPQLGLPMEMRDPPVLPVQFNAVKWPLIVRCAAAGAVTSNLYLSERCSSKIVFDLLRMAMAVLLHPEYVAWPPSVLSCAILAAVTAEYAREADKEAGASKQAELINDSIEAGMSTAAVLWRLAALRPVVWQLIRWYLPGSPHGAPEVRSFANCSVHNPKHDLMKIGDFTLLSPDARTLRKRRREDDLSGVITPVRDGGDSTDAQDIEIHEALRVAHVENGSCLEADDSSPWSKLPSALSWVQSLIDGMPATPAHADADKFLTEADFETPRTLQPRAAATLPYITTYTPELKQHVLSAFALGLSTSSGVFDDGPKQPFASRDAMSSGASRERGSFRFHNNLPIGFEDRGRLNDPCGQATLEPNAEAAQIFVSKRPRVQTAIKPSDMPHAPVVRRPFSLLPGPATRAASDKKFRATSERNKHIGRGRGSGSSVSTIGSVRARVLVAAAAAVTSVPASQPARTGH